MSESGADGWAACDKPRDSLLIVLISRNGGPGRWKTVSTVPGSGTRSGFEVRQQR